MPGGEAGASRVEVVVTTYLEPELIDRIVSSVPRAHVTFVPELLLPPHLPGELHGAQPALDAAQLARWERITAGAEVMFGFDWHQPEALPRRCSHLRLIQATFAGVGGFMRRSGLDQSGIEVTTAAGVHARPLAELVLLGALHFFKGMPRLEALKSERRWERREGASIAGRRALIVGLGAIGLESARLLRALDVEVWGLSRRPRPAPPPGVAHVIERGELRAALRDTDLLVLACALTEQTRGLIGAAELEALPKRAVLVNVSRGGVIDEPALIAALRAGRLAGACLDVFATEPLPPASPLWSLDNVIISPHSAATYAAQSANLVNLFIDNLTRYLDGRPRRNVYDPAAGY